MGTEPELDLLYRSGTNQSDSLALARPASTARAAHTFASGEGGISSADTATALKLESESLVLGVCINGSGGYVSLVRACLSAR